MLSVNFISHVIEEQEAETEKSTAQTVHIKIRKNNGAWRKNYIQIVQDIFCSATVYGRHGLDFKKMDKIRLRQLLTIVTIVSTAIQREEKAQRVGLFSSPKGNHQS